MHTLLSVFFAAIFSFHQPAPQPAPAATQSQITFEHVPSRYELAQLRSNAVYAGSGCLSCRKTAVTYRAR